MIDNLQEYLSPFPESQKLNHLREYLQWLILKGIDEQGLRRNMAFGGGTALHVVYQTKRFSEDLDFSRVSKKKIEIQKIANTLQTYFQRLGFHCVMKRLRDQYPLASFSLCFEDLLFPLRISQQKSQILSIKIEVDLNPPQGWRIENFLFSDPLFFWVTHFDLPSLFATKLHALLYRGFDKGRDFYDLIFFLRKRIMPNFLLFQNAVKQTLPAKTYSLRDEIWEELRKKVEHSNIEHIRRDIRPFLLDSKEENLLSKENILKLIEQSP